MKNRKQESGTAALPPTALVRTYYLAEFRPAIAKRLSRKWVERYDSALRRFEKFVGGRPLLGAVTHELLADFKKELLSRRCSEKSATNLAGCIRSLIRDWNCGALPRVEVLPAAEPGTLRHWFEHRYRPEVQFDCRPDTAKDTLRSIVAFRKHCGNRDIRLDELNDGVVTAFLAELLEKGMPATTANKYRATLLAVWNHAFEQRAVDRPPRVKKLREVRNPPEAWTVAEMKRLLAAARRFQPGNTYGRVRRDRYWPALLLLGYDTGMRMSSLLAVRQEDIDLVGRWLRADGAANKTLSGQCFRLSEDTVKAIREIWDPDQPALFAGATPRMLIKAFGELIEAAAIPKSRRRGLGKFHQLRRTTCTLVAATDGVAAASALLGHSEVAVTRRYIDPTKLRHDPTRSLPSLR